VHGGARTRLAACACVPDIGAFSRSPGEINKITTLARCWKLYGAPSRVVTEAGARVVKFKKLVKSNYSVKSSASSLNFNLRDFSRRPLLSSRAHLSHNYKFMCLFSLPCPREQSFRRLISPPLKEYRLAPLFSGEWNKQQFNNTFYDSNSILLFTLCHLFHEEILLALSEISFCRMKKRVFKNYDLKITDILNLNLESR
jgi:hypothetical protein